MAIFIDVKSRFDDASGRKAAEEAKAYFGRVGTNASEDFSSNFARALERDGKIKAAADKVADSLDKITSAEAKRVAQMEKSKAINDAVAAAEEKLNRMRSIGAEESAKVAEQELVVLRQKQLDVNAKLVTSSSRCPRPKRDRARAVREAGDAYRKMGDDAESAFDKIGKFGEKHGGGALALNVGLTGIGLLPAAATAITEVAGALQQLAGAGFAVPGVFAGIASSVAVGALGMYGMSDAIKAVSKASDGTKASVDAANQALAGLAPAQADVVKTTVGLKGTFDDLRNVAAGNMFAGVSTGLKGLVGADLPAVTRGVDGISRGINQNLTQALSSLGSSSSQGILDRIFGNTADAQSKLTAAIDPAIHAIGTLTAAGSDSLPRLATAIGNVADRFDRFITTADGNGSLKKWIDEGLTGFTQLGNTAMNIATIFTGLTQAAGGGAGLLGTLESATGAMSKFLNSAQGQSQLQSYFAQGRDLLGQLRDVAVSAGPVLAGVFQSGINAANLWLPVIGEALDILNKIPGGAQAVVTAFVAWKTINAFTSVINGLSSITNLLSDIPGKVGNAGTALEGLAGKAGIVAAAVTAAISVGQSNPAVNTSLPLPNGQPNPDINKMTGTDLRTLLPGGAPPKAPAPSEQRPPLFGWSPQPPPGPPPLFGPQVTPGRPAPAPPPSTAAVPGVSSYTAPTITSGAGSANNGKPFVDPSKYMMGDPLAGLPGAAAGSDPQKIYEADSALITQTHNLEQKKLALQVLQAQGNASQQELLTAQNDIQEQERSLYDAQAKDVEARTNQMKAAAGGLKDVFAPMDQDFGLSGGIPGVVKNLTLLFGNLALAGAIKASPSLQSGAELLASDGGVAPGLFNQQYFTGLGGTSNAANKAPIKQQFFGPSGSGGAYPGDAALLSNVPAGRYSQTGAADLTKGLGDCSSAVEDLVNLVDGRPTAGRSVSTGNEAQWLAGRGFQPGLGGPGDFRVGFNDHHTQATLPGGTPFNWGSDAAAGRGGVGGTGADDPAFTDHWFRPAGASYAPVTGSGAAPASSGFGSSGGTTSVFVVNMPGGELVDATGVAAPPLGSAAAPTSTPGAAGVPDLNTNPALTNPTSDPAQQSAAMQRLFGPTGAPGAGPLPGIIPGSAGQGYLGIGAPAGVTGQAYPGAAGGGGGGGDAGGGLIGAAAGMFPGGAQAAALASRAIKFAGQAASIGVEGLFQTFLPAGDKPKASIGASWFGKILGGVGGASPAKPNAAGGKQPPSPTGAGQDGQSGQGNTVNNTLNQTNNHPTSGDMAANSAVREMGAMYSPSGKQ